jgi:colicin import membrane protein
MARSDCRNGHGHRTSYGPDFYWRCCKCASHFYVGKSGHDNFVFVREACGECKQRAEAARAKVGLPPCASDAELWQAQKLADRKAEEEKERERLERLERERERKAAVEAEAKCKAAAARTEVGLPPSAIDAELEQAQKRKAAAEAEAKRTAAAHAKVGLPPSASDAELAQAQNRKAAAEAKAKRSAELEQRKAEEKRQAEEEAKTEEKRKRKAEAKRMAAAARAEVGLPPSASNAGLTQEQKRKAATEAEAKRKAAAEQDISDRLLGDGPPVEVPAELLMRSGV